MADVQTSLASQSLAFKALRRDKTKLDISVYHRRSRREKIRICFSQVMDQFFMNWWQKTVLCRCLIYVTWYMAVLKITLVCQYWYFGTFGRRWCTYRLRYVDWDWAMPYRVLDVKFSCSSESPLNTAHSFRFSVSQPSTFIQSLHVRVTPRRSTV